jgi:predicted phage-related endonuclease
MKIIPVQQGTNQWLQARLGFITASEADALVTPLGKVKTGDSVESYLIKKLCEKFLGYTTEDAGSFAMQQGSLIESVAVPYFEFTTGMSVQRVGLCVSETEMAACSPDGLIGDEGGLEVKCPQPEKALRTLLGGVVPPEHVIQVQFSLYVTQRKWWKYLSFSRHFSPLIIHVEPDEKIQQAIGIAVAQFQSRFDPIMKKLITQREAENALQAAAHVER